MLDSPFTMRGPFPSGSLTLAQRFAAIPKLVDTSGGVVFQGTALTPASTDDPVGFLLNTAQGAGYSGGELTGLGPDAVMDDVFYLPKSEFDVIGEDATHIVTVGSGALRYESDTTTPSLQFKTPLDTPLLIGRRYHVRANVSTWVGGSLKIDGSDGVAVVAASAGANTTTFVTQWPDVTIYRNSTDVDITLDAISINEIPGTQAVTPNSSARPTLQANGSLLFDGVDDQIVIAAPVGGFPSDCDIFVEVSSVNGSTKVVDLDDGSGYLGFAHAESTAVTINSGAGSPKTYFDNVEILTRGELHSVMSNRGILNIRNADLSAYDAMTLSGVSNAPIHGEVGSMVIYDNANGPLTDRQRADIHATLLGGVS